MSAYSDYQVGAISEDEFKISMKRECEDYEEHGCFDCYYRDSCNSKGYYCPVKEGDWE